MYPTLTEPVYFLSWSPDTPALPLNVSELRERLEAAVAVDAPVKPERMTVAVLSRMYLAHAQKEYNGQWGYKEAATIRHSFEPLVMLYGDLLPEEVTPLRLRAARQYWVDSLIARTTIQARMQRLRKAWRWGRSVGLVSADLPDIGNLRYGHAPEPESVKPVDLELVEATLAHVSKSARTLIRLMMYTGMRPGEACAIRADEIDTTVSPWVYRPKHHKQSWRGVKREIYLGPRAQMLLQATLASAVGKTPSIADASRNGATTVPFAPPVASAPTGLLFLTARGQPWKPTSLYMAVFNACRKHDLPAWHPNQIRHSVATLLRKEIGLDAAQAVLGHARVETTQVYSERMNHLASDAALKFG